MDRKEIYRHLNNLYVQISIILLLLFLYVLTKHPLFGLLAAVVLVSMALLEFYEGVRKNGWRHEAVETLKTIAIAVLLWIALTIALSTSSPISAVVSCSMVPSLARGDMIVIKGEEGYSSNVIVAAEGDVAALSRNPVVHFGNMAMEVNGSMYNHCHSVADREVCAEFFGNPASFSETRGEFTFSYAQCMRSDLAGSSLVALEPCISSISYRGKTVDVRHDRSSDIIIYNPKPSDLFGLYGDIVHRAVVQVRTENGTYFLAKGDNNNVFDIQFHSDAEGRGNSPVLKDQIRGKVISRIPYLGYYKLFISFYLNEDRICGTKLAG